MPDGFIQVPPDQHLVGAPMPDGSTRASLSVIPHGTGSGYTYHKCRCDQCKAVQSAYMKEYRKGRRSELDAVTRAWKQANPERVRQLNKDSGRRIKLAVFALYGSACQKCGFADDRALQIDHINGTGEHKARSHRRSGLSLYSAILRGDMAQEDFQLLCANCNWIKRVENDECRRGRRHA